jgi:hypothetical protein
VNFDKPTLKNTSLTKDWRKTAENPHDSSQFGGALCIRRACGIVIWCLMGMSSMHGGCCRAAGVCAQWRRGSPGQTHTPGFGRAHAVKPSGLDQRLIAP